MLQRINKYNTGFVMYRTIYRMDMTSSFAEAVEIQITNNTKTRATDDC